MMAFSTKGRVEATPEDKASWAHALIPRSERPRPSDEEQAAEQAFALANHSHGASDASMYKHLAVQREEGQIPTIPIPTFPALTAPGPTGERAEHLQQCLQTRHLGVRRRLYRALDCLTVRAARGMLPTGARWILNTALVFMGKGADEHDKDPDAEWLWHFGDLPEEAGQAGKARDLGPAEATVEPPGAGGQRDESAAGAVGAAALGQPQAPESCSQFFSLIYKRRW